MQLQQYVKSFSHGQITIPKSFREKLQLDKEFWLRLILEGGRVIAEPVDQKPSTSVYLKNIRRIKGDWFDANEWKKMRKQVSRRTSALP